jgi:hypothetical protein
MKTNGNGNIEPLSCKMKKQNPCAQIRMVSLCSEHLAPDTGDRDSAGVCRGEKLLHRHPGVQSSLLDVLTVFPPPGSEF